MAGGPVVIILGPLPHRYTSATEPAQIERTIKLTIDGLDADPSVDDVMHALNCALMQTNDRANQVRFAELPPADG